jgi:hypothetical protein
MCSSVRTWCFRTSIDLAGKLFLENVTDTIQIHDPAAVKVTRAEGPYPQPQKSAIFGRFRAAGGCSDSSRWKRSTPKVRRRRHGRAYGTIS